MLVFEFGTKVDKHPKMKQYHISHEYTTIFFFPFKYEGITHLTSEIAQKLSLQQLTTVGCWTHLRSVQSLCLVVYPILKVSNDS
jgi:hypothetical protein